MMNINCVIHTKDKPAFEPLKLGCNSDPSAWTIDILYMLVIVYHSFLSRFNHITANVVRDCPISVSFALETREEWIISPHTNSQFVWGGCR